MNNKYYVYCHRNPLTNEIFYIGKGKDRRAYRKENRGEHYQNYVKKYGFPIIEIIKENLTNEESLDLEKKLILEIGRKELNEGMLVNSTNGGESGVNGLIHTLETKLKMSESKKGKPSNNKGKTWKQSIDTKTGVSRGKYKERKDKGGTLSLEMKGKLKEIARNNAKEILQFDLNNNFIKEWRSQADAVESLGYKGIYNCVTGRSKQSGGYIWKYK
jgi:hypothetical protein